MNQVTTIKVNPCRTNLVVPTGSNFPEAQYTMNGFSFYYKGNKRFYGEDCFYYNHYQLSDLMANKFPDEGNQASPFYHVTYYQEWDDKAKQWLEDSKLLVSNVKCIKKMDMPLINKIIEMFGLQPSHLGNIVGLKPHQIQSLALYIALGYSNNWGQMRTGKTPPTILYHWSLFLKGLQCNPDGVQTILCVVPNTIKHTWWNEIHNFAGYQCSTLSDVIEGPKNKKLELWKKNSIFKIVNYESLRSDYDLVKEVYQNKVYSLILDECQAIKNWSQQTRKILDLFKFNSPKYFTALSGTPVANKPEDVYNVVRLTAPTLLGKDKRDFEARYCYLGGYTGNQIIGYRPQALETIHNAMARCSVRALRNEVGMNLGKLVEPVYLDMSKDQKSAHDALRDKFIADLMGWTDETPVRVNNALAQYIKLLEITSGFIYDNNGNVILTKDKDNVKIQWLDEYISDYLEDIEKLVIFTNFVPLIEFMAKRYARYSVEKVYGATKAEERQESVNRFTKGDSHIIIVNMSCAPGLDLNPAQFAVFMNRDFQLLKNLQAEDRITGYNQVGESTIIPILCNHSIDINLEKMLEVKKKNFDIVMEGKAMESSFNITKENLKELLLDV
jgi:hypothetical protein